METIDGDSARIKRLFPTHFLLNYDPFVLLDEFFVEEGSGFPTHPHRGFEAITYMLDGAFRHKDNLGNNTVVTGGGIQRFTAGKGLLHSEMPEARGINHGFQLWINLPGRLKKIDPEYQQVDAKDIPETKKDGITVRTIVGNSSPVLIKTDILYQHILLEKDSEYTIQKSPSQNGFIYQHYGKLLIDSDDIGSGEAYFLENNTIFTLKAIESSGFILLLGQPHNEPIIQRGPYVD